MPRIKILVDTLRIIKYLFDYHLSHQLQKSGSDAMSASTSRATVSIITRTQNRPHLLRRAIRSVLNQSYSDWTHIIVNDGGSKKDVEAIAKEYKKKYAGRLTILHRAASQGREAASNAGLKKCNAPYIVFLDDDDSWHSDFLKHCLAALKASPLPNVCGVMCHSTRIDESIDDKGRIVELRRVSFNDHVRSIDIPRLCAGNIIPNMSFIFKKSLIEKIGAFDESLEVLGDWDFNIRAVLAGEILVVHEPLAFFHHRPTARTMYGNSYYLHKDDLYKSCQSKIVNKWARSEHARGNFSIAQTMTYAAFNTESYTFSRRANKIFDLLEEWAKKL